MTKQETDNLIKEAELNQDATVVADDLDTKNETITKVAVVKGTKTTQEDAAIDADALATKVYESRLDNALSGDKADADNSEDTIKAQDAKTANTDALNEVQERTTETLAQGRDLVQEALDNGFESLEDAQERTAKTLESLKTQAQDKSDELQDKADQKLEHAQEALTGLKDNVQDKTKNALESAKDTLNTLKDKAHASLLHARTKVFGESQEASKTDADASLEDLEDTSDLKDKAQEVLDATYDKVQTLKDEASEQLDASSTALKQRVGDLTERLNALKDDATARAETLKEDTQEVASNLKQSAQEAWDKAQTYHKETLELEGDQGLVKKQLSLIGAYLKTLSDDKAVYAPALDVSKIGADGLSQQALDQASRLFTGKFNTLSKLTKKMLPEDKLQDLNQALFNKLASLASDWAQQDLPANLNPAKREIYIECIANQNRALSALGGACSAPMGLAGVILDAFWVVLVALRSVYQIAHVYGHTLTGREGAQIAFGVLSSLDVQKLQEKQLIQMAVSVGKRTAIAAQDGNLADELSNFGVSSGQIDLYRDQVKALVERFGSKGILSAGILGKLLSLTAISVGVYYNTRLIDEVMGVAKATFDLEQIALDVNASADKVNEVDAVASATDADA